MVKGLVSVVLPIYNVEKYLDRCIKSVVNQSYKNLEIILVDDGSPDTCPQKCEDWAQKDNRIRVIHKANAGLGMARNTGIENATGEYIYFVDSDDYIALNTIEKCYNLAEKEHADIVTFGFCNVASDGRTGNFTVPKPKKYIYEGREVQDIFLPNLIAPNIETGEVTNLWMSACSSFCRLDVIKKANWRFVSEREIISEDVFSLMCFYKFIQKVAIIPEALYFYCENGASLTHTYRKDRYEKIKHFYDCCIKECDVLGYGNAVKERISYTYISYTIAALKMIVTADCTDIEKDIYIGDILKDAHLHKVTAGMNVKKEKTDEENNDSVN